MLGLAWSGIFALSIALSHVYYFIKDQLKLNPFSNLIFLFFCVYLLFMLICQVISFNQKLIYRHQFFGTAMLFAMINGLLLSLVLTDYVIVVLTNNLLRNSFIYTIIFGLSSLILFWGLILYNVRWLKKQLETGFSEQRTNANYVAASSVYSKPSIWIILGATLLGGMMVGLITGYYKQILGIAFFCIVIPMIILGFAIVLLLAAYEEDDLPLPAKIACIVFGVLLLLVFMGYVKKFISKSKKSHRGNRRSRPPFLVFRR